MQVAKYETKMKINQKNIYYTCIQSNESRPNFNETSNIWEKDELT